MLLFLAKKKPSLFLEFSEAVFLLLPSESGNVSFYLENPGGTPGAFLIELDAPENSLADAFKSTDRRVGGHSKSHTERPAPDPSLGH